MPQIYRLEEMKGFEPIEQETTLMCISNGLDAGLMSNAVWKGVAMRDYSIRLGRFLMRASAIYGVDNYTDTFR